jgi:hypothetical protein
MIGVGMVGRTKPVHRARSAALSACTSSSSSGFAPAAASTPIAFAGDRDGDFEIYVVNPDGTSLRRVTNDAGTRRAIRAAVEVEGGRRGGALNLAARLCSGADHCPAM